MSATFQPIIVTGRLYSHRLLAELRKTGDNSHVTVKQEEKFVQGRKWTSALVKPDFAVLFVYLQGLCRRYASKCINGNFRMECFLSTRWLCDRQVRSVGIYNRHAHHGGVLLLVRLTLSHVKIRTSTSTSTILVLLLPLWGMVLDIFWYHSPKPHPNFVRSLSLRPCIRRMVLSCLVWF